MQGYAKWRATQGVVTSAAVEEVRKQHGDILAEVESVMAGFQSRFGVVPEPEPETVHDLLARGETPTYKLVEGRRVFEASFRSFFPRGMLFQQEIARNVCRRSRR